LYKISQKEFLTFAASRTRSYPLFLSVRLYEERPGHEWENNDFMINILKEKWIEFPIYISNLITTMSKSEEFFYIINKIINY